MSSPPCFPSCRSLGLLLLWLAGFGACQDQRAPAGEVDLESVDPRGQEVVFWYQHTRQREKMLLKLIDEFNRSNEYGIQVHSEFAGRYSDIYNKMVIGIQSGSLPDLVVAYTNQAHAYYQAEGTVDLRPYLDSPRWGLGGERADYFEVFIRQDEVGGAQVAFPPNRSMEILYYNADWLRELGFAGPPRTWEEFARMCRRAREQPFSRSQNPARSLGFMLDVDASRLAAMVFSRGGDFMNAARTAYTFDTPALRASLQLVCDLVREGAAELVGEEGGDANEFSVGQLLFVQDSSSGLPFVEVGVESLLRFDWDVAPLPHEGEEPIVDVYGASLAVCRTTPAKELAAWLFVKWFTQPAQQARWVEASNYFPVRRSTAAALGEYFAENPRYKTAFELLEYGKSEPAVVGYEPVRRLIAQAIVEIVEGAEMGKVLARLEGAANATLEAY